MLQTFDERNKDIQININGELFHRDVAGVSPFDSVVQGGDGVWEGLRYTNEKFIFLDEHIDRLYSGAEALSIDIGLNKNELINLLFKLMKKNEKFIQGDK